MARVTVMAVALALLLAACGGGADYREERVLARSLVTDVQSDLTTLGYEPGPVDGIFGPRTSGAIREYQGDYGLPRDGLVSEDLADHIERQVRALGQ